jgi:hypothetical protein
MAQTIRQRYRSDDPQYRRGQRKREKHESENKVRPLVERLNPGNLYNQGYFGDSLSQLYNQGGVQPRQVKPGRRPTRSTMESQAETPASKSGKK